MAADLNDKLRCLRKLVGHTDDDISPSTASTASTGGAASAGTAGHAAAPSRSFLGPLLSTTFFAESLSPAALQRAATFAASSGTAAAGSHMSSTAATLAEAAEQLTASGRGGGAGLMGSGHGHHSSLVPADPLRERKKDELLLSRSVVHSMHPKLALPADHAEDGA